MVVKRLSQAIRRIFLLTLFFIISFPSTLGLVEPAGAAELVAQEKQPQKPEQKSRSSSIIRASVNYVEVSVTVTDQYDRLIVGLDKENFQVFEDKVEQKIERVSSEDVPVSIGIILDSSGSMSDKIERVLAAANKFLTTANPADEFFVITFADSPEFRSDFTNDIGTIMSKLFLLRAKGQTALLDSIYMGIGQLRHAQYGKKALLVISDGGDNHSRYTDKEVKNALKEADAQLYAIGIYESPVSRGRTPEELQGPSLLQDLAEITGGRAYPIENIADLTDTAHKIGLELRNRYTIFYKPSNKEFDGRFRKIKVKINPPKGLPTLTVHAKSGYYSPTQ